MNMNKMPLKVKKEDPLESEEEHQEAMIKILDKMKTFSSTSSANSLWNYFLYIIETKEFQEEINKIRNKHKIIPESLPEEFRDDWIPYISRFPYKERLLLYKKMEKLCLKYALHPVDWEDFIQDLLFYDKKPDQQIFALNERNMFMISDAKSDKEDPQSKEIQKWDAIAFPIILHISPYASERDILEFIRKCYKTIIEPALKPYRQTFIKIKKIRKRNPKKRARDNYIYLNKDKGAAALVRLVGKKFNEALDPGHIGKIISVEKRRRNT